MLWLSGCPASEGGWGAWACGQWKAGGGLQRATVAQEVSVGGASMATILHLALFCELEKVPLRAGEWGSYQGP